MTTDSLLFNQQYFNEFTRQSDEKTIIINSIRKLIAHEKPQSCLEIGMGTTPVFHQQLGPYFQHYTVVEKNTDGVPLPAEVQVITCSWEEAQLSRQYDLIIASHVFYYFQHKQEAIDKMLSCLTENGMLIIVVNGQEEDYGPLKEYFYQNIQRDYQPTYPQVMRALAGKNHLTFSVPAAIHYPDHETLYHSLSLFFDQYPTPYRLHQHNIITYLRQTLGQRPFKLYQKIILHSKKIMPWRYLLDHPDYEITLQDIRLWVLDGVFSPDRQLTNSTPLLLTHLPDMQGRRVLDIGCGTGIISILAVRNGAEAAVAADISPKAVANTRLNVSMHQYEEQITVVQSDLFNNIHGKYHYIFGNLPILEDIWQISNPPVLLLQRFLAEAKEFILPGGRLLFSWASFAPTAPVLSILQVLNYHYTMHATSQNNTMWYVFIIQF
ncbi:Methyltransferase domain-containing protein [Chitinophaga jiangningensis]|uniref:Methyltransferase domain-containing protein n=1 Tax=Chitinophaga jiangningensis TaxID=1419482 RepID=A0A1M6ZXB8_9BACT|nr:methyltransferase [Chitinophaga jiangningensis]SHL35066.1 Methyltransferase domain-containing protein [Chitinophaga jiangningensis]